MLVLTRWDQQRSHAPGSCEDSHSFMGYFRQYFYLHCDHVGSVMWLPKLYVMDIHLHFGLHLMQTRLYHTQLTGIVYCCKCLHPCKMFPTLIMGQSQDSTQSVITRSVIEYQHQQVKFIILQSGSFHSRAWPLAMPIYRDVSISLSDRVPLWVFLFFYFLLFLLIGDQQSP